MRAGGKTFVLLFSEFSSFKHYFDSSEQFEQFRLRTPKPKCYEGL